MCPCISPFIYIYTFTFHLSVLLQLFVYTCAKREYAEKILNILDPQKKVFRFVCYLLVLQKLLNSHKKPESLMLRSVFFLKASSVSGRLHLCTWSLHQGPQHPRQGSNQDSCSGQHASHLPVSCKWCQAVVFHSDLYRVLLGWYTVGKSL